MSELERMQVLGVDVAVPPPGGVVLVQFGIFTVKINQAGGSTKWYWQAHLIGAPTAFAFPEGSNLPNTPQEAAEQINQKMGVVLRDLGELINRAQDFDVEDATPKGKKK